MATSRFAQFIPSLHGVTRDYPEQYRHNRTSGHVLGPSRKFAPCGDLEKLRDMIIVRDVPLDYRTSQDARAKFARCMLATCGMQDENIIFALSKSNGSIYFYGFENHNFDTFFTRLKRHHDREHRIEQRALLEPYDEPKLLSDYLFALMVEKGVDRMSFDEVDEELSKVLQILPLDVVVDSNFIREENTELFRGIRRIQKSARLEPSLRLITISIRALAPIIKEMVTGEQELNSGFLDELQRRIMISRVTEKRPPICIVAGEGDPKPLEHLITCVPGIEVIWQGDSKIVRQLVVGERQLENDDGHRKVLVEELEKRENLYMRIGDLTRVLDVGMCLGELRRMIQKDTRQFQIVGEGANEFVTLSHRRQMKRFCNGVTRLLRERPSKYITNPEIVRDFIGRARGDRSASEMNFYVSDFNVCYFDDLIVTIPQHWSVHCTEFVNAEGEIERRFPGNGPENIPDFIRPSDTSNVVWRTELWHSDFFLRNKAFFREQLLNMFAGDISGIDVEMKQGRFPTTSCLRSEDNFSRTARIRANELSFTEQKPLNIPKLFEMEIAFSELMPIYNAYYLKQLTKKAYGVNALMDVLDSLQDTVILSSRNTQDSNISLTANARRTVIERRLIQLLRKVHGEKMQVSAAPNSFIDGKFHYAVAIENPNMSADSTINGSLTRACMESLAKNRVIFPGLPNPPNSGDVFRAFSKEAIHDLYRKQSSMSSSYNGTEIDEILNTSNLISRHQSASGMILYSAKKQFSMMNASQERQEITAILRIFMRSFEPLSFANLKKYYFRAEHSHLTEESMKFLMNEGAIRKYERNKETVYDLQDTCRIVRNLIYQMNDSPNTWYPLTTLGRHSLGSLPSTVRTNPARMIYLLQFSGDYLCYDVLQLRDILRDFGSFLEEAYLPEGHCFRVRPSVVTGDPVTPEEFEVAQRIANNSKSKGLQRQRRSSMR